MRLIASYGIRKASILSAVVLTAAFVGCGGTESVEQPSQGQISRASAAAQIPPGKLAELTGRVPELLPEKQPEPQPRADATPAQIPARVKQALSEDVLETITGDASFYASNFEGRRTASGIPFRHNQLVAAHRAFPFGTILRVTNLRNDRSVNVRVVDRGPFGNSAKAKRRVLDLSRRAAQDLDFVSSGHAPVRIEVLQWGRGIG